MKRGNQQGATLIEVLVSMFLLGVAVIGFVALQVRSMSVTGESVSRAQAMAIAQDLSERMRANYSQLAAYSAANWALTPNADCYTAACTPAQIVLFDVRLTRDALSSLPNGSISVARCTGYNNTCIYVAWGDTTTATDGGANACTTPAGTYVSGVIPDCVMLEVY